MDQTRRHREVSGRSTGGSVSRNKHKRHKHRLDHMQTEDQCSPLESLQVRIGLIAEGEMVSTKFGLGSGGSNKPVEPARAVWLGAGSWVRD